MLGQSVRAVDRSVSLVRTLAEERRALGLKELAKLTRLPEATVHRLLATLLVHSWVQQDIDTQRYRLGPGLAGIGAIALAHSSLIERGRPLIARVARYSGASSYLAVLVGQRVTYLAREVGAQGDNADFHPGITQPVHCTAGGKLLLAYLPEGARSVLLPKGRPLRRYTPRTLTDLAELEAELGRIVERGYAEDTGEFRENWRSIAVPLRDDHGVVIAAATCGGSARYVTPARLDDVRDEMLQAVEEMGRD